MTKTLKILLVSALLALLGNVGSVLSAQGTRTVVGTVADETGEPLAGVSVLVKGTQVGTVTDIAGTISPEANYKWTFYIPQKELDYNPKVHN